MDNLHFLDLTGLEEDEICKIHSSLFDCDRNISFPWRNKRKSSLKNGRIKPNVDKYCNGTSRENYRDSAEHINYSSDTTYYSYPSPLLPPMITQPMITYVPNHQHPSVYNNFHHPPPMMGSADTGIHYAYQPNEMYNYTHVPVTAQYCPPVVHSQSMLEVHQFYNGGSDMKHSNSEKRHILPQETISNNSEIPYGDETLETPETQHHELNEEKLVTPAIVPSTSEVKSSKKEMKDMKKEINEISYVKIENMQKNIKNSEEICSSESIKENEIKSEVSAPVSVWAKKPGVSLFQKETSKTNTELQIKKDNTEIKSVENTTSSSHYISPATHRLGKFLLSYKVGGSSSGLKPRGLINKSNYCYVNSILQALLACSPLRNLLKGLSHDLTTNGQAIPMIENMCKFINEFEMLPEMSTQPPTKKKKNKRKQGNVNINYGEPFEATSFYTLLNGTRSDSFLVEGRQEDAEEFLGLLLNGLNDEMMSIMSLVSTKGNEENKEDSDEWKVMGPKNKGNITRKVQFDKTPISEIFGGLLCSKIHKAGEETTVNIQPFLTLQLNVVKANDITEALEGLTSKIQLEGLTSSKTKQTVEAWQQVMIEQLPVVLILHLKCFEYQLNGCTKIMKTLDFPVDLNIDSKILSGKANTEKQYKLFAVVYHEGKEASKGHYIADAFHTDFNTWLRFDDAKIKPVLEESVLRPQGYRVPYLLFYRRSDTV